MTKISILVIILALVMSGVVGWVWLPLIAFLLYLKAILLWAATGYFVAQYGRK